MIRSLHCLVFCLVALLGAAPTIAADPPRARPRQINVLLVNGRSGAEELNTPAWFLNAALNPFGDQPQPGSTQVRTTVIGFEKLTDLEARDLAKWDCIFLCDVPRLTRQDAQRLETFVKSGGGVVFCLGPQVDAMAYNKVLFQDGKGLLPVRLLETRKARDQHYFRFAFEEDTFKHPPLTGFADRKTRSMLLSPRFEAFLRVEPDPMARTRTILSFEEVSQLKEGKEADQGIAILECRPFPDAGKQSGRVVLVTTTVNTDWNSWPMTISFPVMVHELMHLAAPDRKKR